MPICLYAGNPAPSTDQGPPWPQDRGRPRPGVVLGPKGTPSYLGRPEDALRPPWPQDGSSGQGRALCQTGYSVVCSRGVGPKGGLYHYGTVIFISIKPLFRVG